MTDTGQVDLSRFARKFGTALLSTGLALALLTSSVADAKALGSRSVNVRAPAIRLSDEQARWESLDDAIQAGILDARVASSLERRGYASGLVQFQAEAEIASTLVGGSTQLTSLERSLAALPDRLTTVKSAVLERTVGVSTVKDYRFLPTSLVKFSSSASLLKVLNSPNVQAVRHDAIQRLMLAESLPLIGQPTAVEAGFGGAGTAVVILDSGVDYQRAAFGNCSSPGVPVDCKVIASRDFAPSDGRLDSGDFHGTNVSGIVSGVAPDAKLLVGDVIKGSSIKVSWVLNGINWAIQNKKNGVDVRSINLSLGTSYTYFNKLCYSSPYTSTFKTARSFGIIPVVSAGNHGFHPWHAHGFHSGVSMPACTPGALSVAASYDMDIGRKVWKPDCVDPRTWADKPVCWTQSGKTVGLFAPGVFITAAGIKMVGTSQAAPHVAGAAAVLGAAYPGASVPQIQSALKSSGPEVYDPGPRITRHRLDIPDALNGLLAGLETTPPVVTPPVQFLPENVDVIPPNVPVAVEWSATDASGIHEYVLQISENGTLYSVLLDKRTSTEALLDLAVGSRYQFAVAARDKAGNWSDWVYGPEFVPAVYQEDDPAITYSAGWERLPWTQAWAGFQMSSETPDASAALSFSGMDVAWVGVAGPQNGFADVLIDGTAQFSVDAFSFDVYPRLILGSWHWETAGLHTMGLSVMGDGQTDVDAFIVLRP